MIPKEIVDRIYATAKIEEVVGDYVSLKRRGASLWGLCPFPGHTEKTPSFCVTPARNICKCFGCGKGGNAINFVMAMEQCNYPEALGKVAAKYHIEIPKREMTEEEKQREDNRESMLVVNTWANQWYQDQLWKTEEGQAIALSYFHQRGLRDETIKKFQLGYSPEKAYLLPQAARKQGFVEEFLINNPETNIGTGICGQSTGQDKEGKPQKRLYDRYHGRVMFPLLDIGGKTVAFAGRILEKKENVGKYVNSPESIIFSKKNQLYGLYQAKLAIGKQKKCYLVEGQMDCISMSQAGVENVVCSGGTALTKEQIALIHRFTNNVTILYDGDAAGIHASLRGIDMFLEQGLFIKVMLFPDGDDPDSFARKHTSEEFVEYINTHEEDFIGYMARTLLAGATDARQRSEAVHTVANSISLIDDRITRDLYIKDSARIMNMDEKTILSSVINLRRKHREEREAEEAAKNAWIGTGSGQMAVVIAEGEPGGDSLSALVSIEREEPEFVGIQATIHQNFLNLLRGLIRYGELTLSFAQQGAAPYVIRVGEYMQQYLTKAQIPVTEPIVQKFFSEYAANKDNPGFRAESFFTQHPDAEISALAADLLSEQQVLSNIYAKQELDANGQPILPTQTQLVNLMMQLLYELHMSIVNAELEELGPKLAEAESAHDDNAFMAGLSRQSYLTSLRQNIADLLGKY